MTYQTSTSIKGWLALLVIGVGSLYCISAQAPGHTLQDRVLSGLILTVGLWLGIIWLRNRKRIRRMERQTQTLRKGLHRIGVRTRPHERKQPRHSTLTFESIGYRKHSAGD